MKFRSSILVLSVVAICLSPSAQIQQAWVAKYNNGIPNGNHQALKMALDSTGNIYALGVSANANTNTGYVVVKYAPNGNQVWAARYDATNFPSSTPTGFALDNSNNVIVTGSAMTVKYDPLGNELWTAPYDAQGVALDAGQNIYLTGNSSKFTSMKLNPMGSNLWSASYNNPAYSGGANMAQVIAVDSFSNVYVAGWEKNNSPFPMNFVNMAVLKYDSNGGGVWSFDTEFVSLAQVSVVALALDRLNDVCVEANFGNNPGGYQTYKLDSAGTDSWSVGYPPFFIPGLASGLALDRNDDVCATGGAEYPVSCYGTYKIATNGAVLWTNLYPASGVGTGAATAIVVDQNNNVYVTGYSTLKNTGSDIATVRYDGNGNQVWVERFDGPGHGNDAGNAIAVDNSGNVYVAGYETETNGFTSMVLIKYSPVTGQKQSNGNFILQAFGSPGESFDIQASTNLQTWDDLGIVSADTNGLASFDDTNAPLFPARFYYTVPQ